MAVAITLEQPVLCGMISAGKATQEFVRLAYHSDFPIVNIIVIIKPNVNRVSEV
jgi:hypothetical protein